MTCPQKSRRPIRLTVVLPAIVAMLLSACGGDETGGGGGSAAQFEQQGQVQRVDDTYSFSAEKTEAREPVEEPWDVHFAQYWTGTPVLAAFRDHLTDIVKRDYPNVKLSISDAENDPTKLVSDIETAITRQVDAIIVNAGDGTTPVPAVERAVEAGIPVIAMQKRIDSDQVSVTAVADDREQGRKQGEALVAELEERNNGEATGEVIVVNGIPAASLTVEQNRGFRGVLKEYPGVKIVCDQPGNFARAEAVKVLENCLQAHPDADAVWYIGADVGTALASVLRSSGKTKDTFIVGGGGNRETLEVLGDGGPVAFDLVFPDCALPAIEATRRILEGQQVPGQIIVHAPGINEDNVDRFLEGDAPYVRYPTELPEPWQK